MLVEKTQDQIERERQIQEARSMGDETVIARATPRKTYVNNSTQPRLDASKTAFQAKGHDAVLKSAQDRQAPVQFTIDGKEKTGVIVARDRYTISVIFDGDDSATIVYKHVISMFKPLRGAK